MGETPSIYLAFSDNGEHIRFWTASPWHAREWARENWETEPFYSGAQMTAARNEIERLREWIEGDARCPCCDTFSECDDECTFADDCPIEHERMMAARAVLAPPNA